MHSHNYRVPEVFQDQVVVLVGSSISADEISRDIAGAAKEVHVTSRSVKDETYEQQTGYDNIWMHSMIERVHEDGFVVFRNGRVVVADTILYCTGYKYHFPFLETNGIVTVDDNRVGPLYKHVFPPVLGPWLSFVGLQRKVAPFPIIELQSKWIAGVLSGRIDLPSLEEMMEDTCHLKLQTSPKGTLTTWVILSLSIATGLELNAGVKGLNNGENRCIGGGGAALEGPSSRTIR